jgi:hypothetical protein
MKNTMMMMMKKISTCTHVRRGDHILMILLGILYVCADEFFLFHKITMNEML